MKVGLTLFFLWCAHLFMDFFTGIWPIYKTIAEIDIAKAGIIIGISGFIGEILQLGFGFICDRGYRKYVLLFGLACASCILCVTFTKEIIPCFFILLVLMIGSGAFHPAATGFASLLSNQHKGRMILLFASGGAIGLGISQIAFIKLRDMFGGHALILFVPFVLLAFFLFFHSFPKPAVAERTKFSFKKFLAPIMHCKKELLLLYFSQVASQTIAMSFYFLMPDLLKTKGCHSWLCYGGGHLCFVIGSALTMVPAGFLCDKFGQKSVLLTVLCIAIAALYVFLGTAAFSLTTTIILLTVLGAFIGVINPIIVSWGNRLVPESPSTVSAILMGCAWCLGNLGPAFAGILTQLFTENPYTKTLLIIGSLLILILICVSFIPRPARSYESINYG